MSEPVEISVRESEDGVDENLLILLHGLGDTHKPFAKLGTTLQLPQTATLALRAPDLIPYLYEEAYQWYESFDPLGELLRSPNPTPALALLTTVLEHLHRDCGWPVARVHLFGFAQGGTLAAEFALRWWRTELARTTAGDAQPRALGTVVSVCGPLLSYPTALQRPCPTPLLVAHRPAPAESALPPNALAAFGKGYSFVKDVSLGAGEGMPRNTEWKPIVTFWSEHLSYKVNTSGLYELTNKG
ncbi:hypothetical protein PHLGIDRAFT_196338 [Phlebiopsis gigantea 11061_1 CR5-6]|uniref:Phospholipase/carboxylesterase/thioesterase domain-containing protein n=1 Tax=Phlebiopsis gigantea (strain 11061_1 CR5-6) TaxID=745531 RepID=A0A0C3SCA8_PHLG1|nr:hypothetical protein PHLGIDRAFT_196338 [Phlebiopsis gigantea 11061_1 CR5-6]